MAMRQPALLDAIEGAIRLDRPGRARYIITGPSREVTYRATVTPVRIHGESCALCAFEDITEQEQMGAIRRDFVANVSTNCAPPSRRSSASSRRCRALRATIPRHGAGFSASWRGRRAG